MPTISIVGSWARDDKLNVVLANPEMIEAYRAGIPGNGQPFPDGSKIMKILWNPKQHEAAPFAVQVPGTLSGIGCMVKDSKRFAETGGWGYAQFDYDSASDTFTPNTALQENDAKCGAACHRPRKPRISFSRPTGSGDRHPCPPVRMQSAATTVSVSLRYAEPLNETSWRNSWGPNPVALRSARAK